MTGAAVVVRAIAPSEIAARHAEFVTFERGFTYPLGDDRFWIDHGADYLAFFRGLGEPTVWIAELGGALVGVCVGVTRALARPTLYVCDLKVAPVARGGAGAMRLLRGLLADWLAPGCAGFGVSMNPAVGNNRLRRVARRLVGAALQDGPALNIWSLSFEEWQRTGRALEAALGPVGFFDPAGTKDIVLGSTGRPMALLHLQHGPFARGGAATTQPRPGAVHMLGLPVMDPLTPLLHEHVRARPATASVLHLAMARCEWRHLLTSDI